MLIFLSLASQSSAGAGVIETFVESIGIAVLVGVVVGAAGAWLLVRSSKAGWTGSVWSNIAVMAIASIAFVAANSTGGSGFIAAFVAGMMYGSLMRNKIKATDLLAADLSLGMVQVSFLMVGALVLVPELGNITWQIVIMVLLALTVARIIPVAIAMIGTHLAMPTVLYMGWFGPRGLATIVYAVLFVATTELSGVSTITTVAVITVGVSVFAHGLTSYPGSQKYADWYEAQDHDGLVEAKPVHHHQYPRLRRLVGSTRSEAKPTPG